MASAGTSAYGATKPHAGLHGPPGVVIRMTGDPIRILIVENQLFVSDALQALLSLQTGMVVVGNVGSVADTVAELNPDIVILEFHLNDEVAAGALKTIFQASSEAKVIFMTSDEDDRVILAAIDAGASAVLYMSSAASEVIETIRTVAGGGSPVVLVAVGPARPGTGDGLHLDDALLAFARDPNRRLG